jgi:alpha-L-rhamnosidase
MKVQDTIRPIRLTKTGKGGWLFEFDRFFSGWVRLNIKGKAGTKIILRYEEGEQDSYILKGAPEGEVYEPRFAFHPVRHVRLEGLEEEPTLDTLAGREVYSDVDPYGSFTCSNELLNKIHGNIQQSLKVGLKGFILDCLHREPIAYNEPASIFGSLSTRKFMPDLWAGFAHSIQLAGSADGDLSDVVPRLPGMDRGSDVSQNASYPMLIWYLYQCHGDERLLEQHYQTVKAWVDFIGRKLADSSHIVKKGWLGEHMLPKRGSPGWDFISKETPKDLIWTCFYYQNARVLSNMGRVLGKKEDEKRYAALAEEIRAAINKTWLDPRTGHYGTRSQTSEILPLAIGIVPPQSRKQLVESIARTITEADGGKFRVGHVGLPGYMESLVENGLGEIVYKTVNTTEFPGWGYMISQGATTVWEGWSLDGGAYPRAESMTMLTGVCRFFYDGIAGIQEPTFYGTREFKPGYGVIRIKPHVLGDLTYARASIKTIRGIISSSWKKTGNSLVLNVTIPANAKGQVSVPLIRSKDATVTEGGNVVWKDGAYVKGLEGITKASQKRGYVTFDVGSGEYQFKVE